MSLLAPIYNCVKSILDNIDTKVSSRLAADDPRLAQIITLIEYLGTPASSNSYTPERATLIDLLMPLTGVRVSNLDKLDTTLSAVIAAINNYSPIRSIQTGFISSAISQAVAGEDARYVDVIISPINIQKSMPSVQGYFVNAATATPLYFARLVTGSALRISSNQVQTALNARWYVIEYK